MRRNESKIFFANSSRGSKTCGYLRKCNATCSHRTLKLEARIMNDVLARRLFMNDFTFVNSETGEWSGKSIQPRAESPQHKARRP